MNLEPAEGSDDASASGTSEPSSVAARHLLPQGEGKPPVTEAERWILTRLKQTLNDVEQHFVSYRFDYLAQALYEFVWNEFCDWFLELSKPALNGDDAAAAASTRHTLLVVLESVLRAMHPVIPFITEEIWQAVAPKLGLAEGSLMQRPWPKADEIVADDAATAEIEWFKNVLSGIRKIRSEMNISPGKTIPLLLADGDASDRARVAKFAAQISFLARVESPQWIDSGADEPAAAAAVVGSLRVMIPLAGTPRQGNRPHRNRDQEVRRQTRQRKLRRQRTRRSRHPGTPTHHRLERHTDRTARTSAEAGLKSHTE